ncbi:MAG: fdrA domain protein [Rhodospirillales bacterium]|nr:fdrA domain protein [Rhodospirillales bacterium]
MEKKAALPAEIRVINIGLPIFAEDLRADEIAVVQMDWRPPTGGDARLAALLASLDDDD